MIVVTLALMIVGAFVAAVVLALTSLRTKPQPRDHHAHEVRKPDPRERYSVSSFSPMSNNPRGSFA